MSSVRQFAQRSTAFVVGGLIGHTVVSAIVRRNELQNDGQVETAATQFIKASKFGTPTGWNDAVFKLKVDYPRSSIGESELKRLEDIAPASPPSIVDAPWEAIDFKTQPEVYAEVIKEYCFEGNREVDFKIESNTTRDWYHAAWMHYANAGREPLRGLTFERGIPPREFASTQTNALQTWAISFYNGAGASVFGEIWSDPAAPTWTSNIDFPLGSCPFKLLFSTADESQVQTLARAPTWKAVIAEQPDPQKIAFSGNRKNTPDEVRLIQVDWAVRDSRSEVGWVFGTFAYDGKSPNASGWDRLMLVGLQWGNDPDLTQSKFEEGETVKESFVTQKSKDLLVELGGERQGWGWNGRLNGPADNFVSSCIACHSTAEKDKVGGLAPADRDFVRDAASHQIKPKDDNKVMRWFRNLPRGVAFDADLTRPTANPNQHLTADYSLQLKMGWANYQQWKRDQGRLITPGRMLEFVSRKPDAEQADRQGPDMSRIKVV